MEKRQWSPLPAEFSLIGAEHREIGGHCDLKTHAPSWSRLFSTTLLDYIYFITLFDIWA